MQEKTGCSKRSGIASVLLSMGWCSSLPGRPLLISSQGDVASSMLSTHHTN